VGLESLGGRRGPRALVLLGLAPRRRQGNIILVCMETSNCLVSLTSCIFVILYMIVFIVSYLICVLQYMISLVYCIFVVCAKRLICWAQFRKADIAERGRATVISRGPKKHPRCIL
jgi:hypothetical protein